MLLRLKIYQDRFKKGAPFFPVHFMTLEEALALKAGDQVMQKPTMMPYMVRCRVTSVYTKKKQPGHVEVHLKYGLKTPLVAIFHGGEWTAYPLVVVDPEPDTLTENKEISHE